MRTIALGSESFLAHPEMQLSNHLLFLAKMAKGTTLRDDQDDLHVEAGSPSGLLDL